MKTVEERFWSRVDAAGDCWQWTGGHDGLGYSRIRVQKPDGTRVRMGVHRWAWEHLVGPIPDGYTIDHLCRNHGCVNPDHMEPVPHGVNVIRSNNAAALNARKVQCLNGHWFSPENTNHDANNRRNCRTCRREYMRARRAKAAA